MWGFQTKNKLSRTDGNRPKAQLFGSDAKKKSPTFGMQIWFEKVGLF